MMPTGSRMDRDDFERALANAADGLIVTDQGADDRLLEALDAIAADAPNPRPELIKAARDAFAG